ncbi:MAG: heme-binding protein [Burkholderiaceae bacterium]
MIAPFEAMEHAAMYLANAKRLTLAGAEKMCAGVIAGAQAQGLAVCVVVVDAGGHVILAKRMDGGRFHTMHSATTKAVSAASNKRITTTKGAVGQDLDTGHALGLALAAGAQNWTAMEGGAPVIVEGECIGGVGVSGGSWSADAALAQAGVEAIGAAVQIDAKP